MLRVFHEPLSSRSRHGVTPGRLFMNSFNRLAGVWVPFMPKLVRLFQFYDRAESGHLDKEVLRRWCFFHPSNSVLSHFFPCTATCTGRSSSNPCRVVSVWGVARSLQRRNAAGGIGFPCHKPLILWESTILQVTVNRGKFWK